MARDPRRVLLAAYVSRKPECFNDEAQYREHQTLKKLSGEYGNYPGVCMDCLPEFKERMMCEGRCEHPETIFVQAGNKYGELETVGVNALSPWYKHAIKGQIMFRKRHDVEED